LAQAEGLLAIRSAPFDAKATWADIARVHDPAYVQAVRIGTPRSLAESQGFVWSPEFAEAVARIWSGHVAACRLALIEGLVLHPVSGSHHAQFGQGSGFCTFNYLVGAARQLLADGLDRVAVIDLDAHPGDGTYALAKDDPGIAIFDIAAGTWVNVERHESCEYHDVDDAAEYRAALQKLPPFLDRVKPGLVMYQAGMDPFQHDPVGGIDGVTAEFLRWRDQFVLGHLVHRGIPVVVNLAGGYLEDGTAERLHVETVRIAANTLRRHRAGELCCFDADTGLLTDDALHAELLGDDMAEWDLDLGVCEEMSDAEMDAYFDEHARKHYGSDKDRER